MKRQALVVALLLTAYSTAFAALPQAPEPGSLYMVGTVILGAAGYMGWQRLRKK